MTENELRTACVKEAARILRVSEEEMLRFEDYIQNSILAVFRMVDIKTDEDKRTVYKALEDLWQKGVVYQNLKEVSVISGIEYSVLRNLDYETQLTISTEYIADPTQIVRFYELTHQSLAVSDLPDIAKLLSVSLKDLNQLPRHVQEQICGAYCMEYDEDSDNAELIDYIREMIAS